MVRRGCSECMRNLPHDSFSKNQWRKGVGVSRCNACVHGEPVEAGSKVEEAATRAPDRRPDSCAASHTWHDLAHPFAEGGFRWVALGTYTQGRRKGQRCVTKWFKSGHVLEAHYFDKDIKAVDKALDIVRAFNCEGIIRSTVKLNVPEVWTFAREIGSSWSGRMVLNEPFVDNYTKFNSNSGWSTDTTPWPRVMQALSHFSYHKSGGQFVLCDLQGGVYHDGVVLTDPVVLSRTRAYGVTDLGPDGIVNFFHHHSCNEFCRSEWTQPQQTRAYYKAQKGTCMQEWSASEVPARASREPMSTRAMMPQVQEEDDEASYASASESYGSGYGYDYYSDDSY